MRALGLVYSIRRALVVVSLSLSLSLWWSRRRTQTCTLLFSRRSTAAGGRWVGGRAWAWAWAERAKALPSWRCLSLAISVKAQRHGQQRKGGQRMHIMDRGPVIKARRQKHRPADDMSTVLDDSHVRGLSLCLRHTASRRARARGSAPSRPAAMSDTATRLMACFTLPPSPQHAQIARHALDCLLLFHPHVNIHTYVSTLPIAATAPRPASASSAGLAHDDDDDDDDDGHGHDHDVHQDACNALCRTQPTAQCHAQTDD